MIKEISPDELKLYLDLANEKGLVFEKGVVDRFLLLDVRELDEVMLTKIGDPLHIPLGQVVENKDLILELSQKVEKVIVICRVGGRSEKVVNFFDNFGVDNFYNLVGGINEYSKLDQTIISY